MHLKALNHEFQDQSRVFAGLGNIWKFHIRHHDYKFSIQLQNLHVVEQNIKCFASSAIWCSSSLSKCDENLHTKNQSTYAHDKQFLNDNLIFVGTEFHANTQKIDRNIKTHQRTLFCTSCLLYTDFTPLRKFWKWPLLIILQRTHRNNISYFVYHTPIMLKCDEVASWNLRNTVKVKVKVRFTLYQATKDQSGK
jgi:hypothetical protein